MQNRWMAENKSRRFLPLFLHSIVYSAVVGVFSLPAGGVNISGMAIIFFSHIILDRRTVVQWWLTNINKSPDIFWLQVMVDQTFHLLILALVTKQGS